MAIGLETDITIEFSIENNLRILIFVDKSGRNDGKNIGEKPRKMLS
jgi:hypothetical protein